MNQEDKSGQDRAIAGATPGPIGADGTRHGDVLTEASDGLVGLLKEF